MNIAYKRVTGTYNDMVFAKQENRQGLTAKWCRDLVRTKEHNRVKKPNIPVEEYREK